MLLNLRNFVLALIRTHRDRVWSEITAASDDGDMSGDLTLFICLKLVADGVMKRMDLALVLRIVPAVLQASTWLPGIVWLCMLLLMFVCTEIKIF